MAGRDVDASADLARQMSMASGQRGWKRQPRRRIGEIGRRAFERRAWRDVADPRQARDQMRGVGVARLREELRRCGPPRPAGPHT